MMAIDPFESQILVCLMSAGLLLWCTIASNVTKTAKHVRRTLIIHGVRPPRVRFRPDIAAATRFARRATRRLIRPPLRAMPQRKETLPKVLAVT